MGRLDGKVALISGGARGQGATEARMMAREGAQVVFGDILDDAGRQVEVDIRAAGGKATYVHLNVTGEADWRAAVHEAEQTYRKLNVLVNNGRVACHRSWLRCKFSQSSGVVRNALDNRSAISGVTAPRPFTIFDSVLREIPRVVAACAMVIPNLHGGTRHFCVYREITA